MCLEMQAGHVFQNSVDCTVVLWLNSWQRCVRLLNQTRIRNAKNKQRSY